MNSVRDAERHPGLAVHAGQLYAMGLIDEASHALMARYREQFDPAVMTSALDWFSSLVGAEPLGRLLLTFVEEFPGIKVMRGEVTARKWLAGETDGLPDLRRGRRPPRAETANVRRSMLFRVLPRRVHFQQEDWRAAEQPGPPRQTRKRPSVRSPLCRDPGRWSTIRVLRRKGSSRFSPGREFRRGDGEETHFIANGNQSHRISVRLKNRHRGAPEQSPAPRSGKRINGGLFPCDPHASGSHLFSWSRQPRSRKLIRQIAKVGKSRGEPQKVRAVGLRSVKFYGLFDGQTVAVQQRRLSQGQTRRRSRRDVDAPRFRERGMFRTPFIFAYD